MSEEILKALMQLFAIIAKQDEGVNIDSNERKFVIEFLKSQLNQETVNEYINLFDQYAGIHEKTSEKQDKKKLTSVRDSVKILGICRKINQTLNQEQKIIVIVRLYEMVNADKKFTSQRMSIINTVAEVFKISPDEISEIQTFIIQNAPEKFDISSNFMIINSQKTTYENAKYIKTEELNGNIFVLHVNSVDLYFLKYTGNEELYFNGLIISRKNINLFATGSTIKLPKGKPLYYSDVTAHYLEDITENKISFHCNDISYKFPNGVTGIDHITFSENHGKFVGIIGVSGAGKTTLLNVLNGIEKPGQGNIFINGIDLHKESEKIEGVFGMVPQEDLLIEDLTIYENLYFNAKLCFKDKSKEDINRLVLKTLESLGLLDQKHLKVGSPLNKIISGGQRKRLNIALELIREPSILFVDEPTTGLSSRDSENVMDLLRELSLKGKLVIAVIHQPSSETYKMFDNVMVLDIGGRMIYYGNPIEAVMYFKRMDAQINSNIGECPTCGSVNPELIFNVIEARVVDEFGRYTDKRRISPKEWENRMKKNISIEEKPVIHTPPPKTLNIPGWLKQCKIYFLRDLVSKISNKQYILLTLLEAPILGFILSFIVRHVSDPDTGQYLFRENENIPRFIFMTLIVGLFLGLIVSAEEIFRDQKLLKREHFLNLSRSGYLVSKIFILFLISAIQAFLFLLVANNILEIKGMFFYYWIALFTTAAFANLLGLIFSASFNSVVTIYIMIPLAMIPMMILSGAMFEFDKLNRSITSVGKVPVIAELMPTKWSYEALMVKQFKDNRFEKEFYPVEKMINKADYKKVYYLPELSKHLDQCKQEFQRSGGIDTAKHSLVLLKNELTYEKQHHQKINYDIPELTPDKFNLSVAKKVTSILDKLERYYQKEFNKHQHQKEKMIQYWMKKNPELFYEMKNRYYNENVADIVKQLLEDKKIIESQQRLYPKIYPIYLSPKPVNKLNFRTHLFAPQKKFLGFSIDTFWFNIALIWIYALILYLILYYDMGKKMINAFNTKKY